MNLWLYEWRKLFRLPMLWLFLALCWLFNGLLIAGVAADRMVVNDVSTVTAILGQRVDETFIANLHETSAEREKLLTVAQSMENIFAEYDTKDLSYFYQTVVQDSPRARVWIAQKYTLLQERVDHLAQEGAAMDLYAGTITHKSHRFLFDTLLRAVLAESAILAMLATLYLLGYEDMQRTTAQFCTMRTGRQLWQTKCLAAVVSSLMLYLLLLVPTLAGYFALYHYDGLWSASVSSQFNYLTDMLYRRPFLTWGDFSVASYLAAVIALSAVLTVVFCLAALGCGLLVKDIYVAVLILSIFCFGGLGVTGMLANSGWWCLYFVSLVHPVDIWLCISGWFTELGLNAILPWQETLGTLFNIILGTMFTVWALRRFKRKDLMR